MGRLRFVAPLLIGITLAACTGSTGIPQAGLRGSVVDAYGRPVAGAVVSFHLASEALASPAPILFQTVTDSSGHYNYAGAPAGVYNVLISKQGTNAIILGLRVEAAGNSVLPRAVAQKPGTILGTVSLTDAGAPEGAMVFISGTNLMGIADRNGAYTITNVPSLPAGASYRVVAMLAGYAKDVEETVTVRPSSPTTVGFSLNPMRIDTAFGKTVTVNSGSWSTSYFWCTCRDEDISDGVSARYVSLDAPEITEDVITNGAVMVFFEPYLWGSESWSSLPFTFGAADFGYIQTFTFDISLGRIHLWAFRTDTATGRVVGADTYTIPDRDFKYTIINAGALNAALR